MSKEALQEPSQEQWKSVEIVQGYLVGVFKDHREITVRVKENRDGLDEWVVRRFDAQQFRDEYFDELVDFLSKEVEIRANDYHIWDLFVPDWDEPFM
jgi:hypothetical protein